MKIEYKFIISGFRATIFPEIINFCENQRMVSYQILPPRLYRTGKFRFSRLGYDDLLSIDDLTHDTRRALLQAGNYRFLKGSDIDYWYSKIL